jgi:hypothetical protein
MSTHRSYRPDEPRSAVFAAGTIQDRATSVSGAAISSSNSGWKSSGGQNCDQAVASLERVHQPGGNGAICTEFAGGCAVGSDVT